jgi:hypothetical protein
VTDAFTKAIGYLYDAELIDYATLEEAQALAEREVNPRWWKVFK